MAEKKPLTTEEPVNTGLKSTMGERGLLVGRTLSPVSSYLHRFSSPVFLIPYVCFGFLLRVPSVLRFCSLLFASVCPLSSPRVVRPRCPPMLLVLGQPGLRWDSCFNGGLLDVHRMEELLGLVQLRGEGEDHVDGDGGLPDCCCFPSISVFCIFPSLPFLSCCLCYYWKTKTQTQTKTMVDGDGGLNRGDRGSSPVFFFVLVSVLLLSVPLSFARSAPPFSFLLFSVSPSLSFLSFFFSFFLPCVPSVAPLLIPLHWNIKPSL